MNMPKKQQGPEHKYDPAFKIAIAREYFTTSLGHTKLAHKYNLPGEATVRHFVRWYKKKYPDGVVPDQVDTENQQGDLLSKDAQDNNLKILALQMLIENASKELGVDIVKKFGTKQPKK